MEGVNKMNRLRGLHLVVLAVFMVSSIAMVPATVSAEGSASLSIAPTKTYTIEPGKSIKDTLVVRNIDPKLPLSLSLRPVDFTYNNDSGTPKLLLDPNEPQKTWSLKPFIKLPDHISIGPNSTQTINISISIPENQGAGSYYSAIVYSSGAPEGDVGNVGLSASGVTLVFVNIPGEVKEDLRLTKLGAYEQTKDGGEFRRLFFDKPKVIAYTLANNGNVTEAPDGSITLKNLFGKEINIQNINPNGSLALIGQTRTFTTCIKLKSETVNFGGARSQSTSCAEPNLEDLWPGFYKIELSAIYGQNGNLNKDLTGSSWFWYMPWWFIALLVAILMIVTYQAWKLKRYLDSRNRKAKFKK